MSDLERLEDLAITEALGRDIAPDLSAHIMGAIDSELNNAETPRRGVASVRGSLARRSFTQRVAKSNSWRSRVAVLAVMATVLVGLVIYASRLGSRSELPVEDDSEVAREKLLENDHKPSKPSDKRLTEPSEVGPEIVDTPDKAIPPAIDSDPMPDGTKDKTNIRPDKEPESDDVEPAPSEVPVIPEPKREDVIDNPPSNPEPTEAKDPAEIIRALPVLATIGSLANARITYDVGGRTVTLNDQTIRVGATVECTTRKKYPAVFVWNTGAQTSFYGTIKVTGADNIIRLRVITPHLYIDCLNCQKAFEIAIGKQGKEAFVTIENSSVLIDKMAVVCLSGQARCGDSVITSGQMAGASRKQEFGKAVDASRKIGHDKLLKNTPSHQIHYYDFRNKDDSDYYKGLIIETKGANDGFAIVGKDSIGFNLPEQNHIVTPNETILIRMRCTGCTQLRIQAFCKNHDDNYGYDVSSVENGIWFEFEITLNNMHGRADRSRTPSTGDVLTSLSITGIGKPTVIEVDSVSWVRSAIPTK